MSHLSLRTAAMANVFTACYHHKSKTFKPYFFFCWETKDRLERQRDRSNQMTEMGR